MAIVTSRESLNGSVEQRDYGNFRGQSEVIDGTRYFDWSGGPTGPGAMDPKLPLWDANECDRPTVSQLIKMSSHVQTVLGKLADAEANVQTYVVRRIDDCTTSRLGPDEVVRHRYNDGSSSPVATLAEPVPGWNYRFWRKVVSWDLRGYGNLLLLKWQADAEGRLWLPPVDPSVFEVDSTNRWASSRYIIGNGEKRRVIDPENVAHLREMPLCPDGTGTSPLWGLSDAISELRAATQWRRGKHENGWDASGVIETEADADLMSPEEQDRATNRWNMQLASSRRAGAVTILQPGQKYKPLDFDPKDMEYIAIRDLTLAEVARRYHCPPSQVGIFRENSGTSYNSAVDQRRDFTQSCVQPKAEETNEIITECLREFYADDSLEVVSNFAPHLRADPEKHSAILVDLVEQGIITVDEARKELDRVPLNTPVSTGLNPPLNSYLGNEFRTKAAPVEGGKVKALAVNERRIIEAAFREEIERHVARWERKVKSSLGADETAKQGFSEKRFTVELTDDLRPLIRKHLKDLDADAAARFGVDPLEDQAFWLRFASETAEELAEDFVSSVQYKLTSEDAATAALNQARSQQAGALSRSLTSHIDGVTSTFAATRSGLTSKTWATTSGNPRSTHARIAGQTVAIGERFSNGARWPGDSSLSLDERAGCQCQIIFS